MNKLIDLIKVVYKLSKNNKPIIGIIYTTCGSFGLRDIPEDNLDKFLDGPVEMLYIKSLVNDNELQIYANELKNFEVNQSENILCIITNHGETKLTY